MRRPNGHKDDGKRPGRLRLQWLLAAVLLLTFAAALMVNGLVHGDHSADSAADPQVTNKQHRPAANPAAGSADHRHDGVMAGHSGSGLR
jgi:hypothetical protein